jgi:TRAP transporter TAXI family solute receptor
MGPSWTFHQRIGEALRSHARDHASFNVELISSAGVISNLDALQQGLADIGIAFAHAAYFASIGQLLPNQEPYDRLRGIAVLPVAPAILLAAPRSQINGLEDLSGRRIGMGTTSLITVPIILEAVNAGAAKPEMVTRAQALKRLSDGTLDAFIFVGDAEPIVPEAPIEELVRDGMRVVPLVGPSIDRVLREYPFMRPIEVPNGADGAQRVRTIGVDRLLICRRDLEDEVVFEFTQFFFDALSSLSLHIVALRDTDLELAPATPIPLHDGASQYYRQVELSR